MDSGASRREGGKKWQTHAHNGELNQHHFQRGVHVIKIKRRVCRTRVLTSVSNFSHLAHSSSPSPPSSSSSSWSSCDSAIMYLLFSRLAIGGDHSSFALAVHLGGCSETLFYPTRHLSKKAARETYYLHSYPVSAVSLVLPCALLAPVSFFLHPQHCPQIRQGLSRGELETVHRWSFFFSIAVPGFCSRPLRCETVGAS